MKIKDVLRISLSNIRVYFRRNLMIVMVMGIIFGLIFAMNLWLQGLENSYIKLASAATDGKVILEATNNTNGIIADETTPSVTREAMIDDITAHSGRILGDVERFSVFGGVIVPENLVSNAIQVDLSKVPTDAAPVLVSTSLSEILLYQHFPALAGNAVSKQKTYEEYRDSVIGQTFTDSYGAKYFVVGLTPGSFHISNLSLQQLERNNHNLLNPILELIPTLGASSIIIDNGQSVHWQVAEVDDSQNLGAIDNDRESLLVMFENLQSAYNYFRHGKGKFINIDLPNRTYFVTHIAGMPLDILYIFNAMQFVINLTSIFLGVIAMIVVIFTSIRLVDQDQRNISLYYSLGATRLQVGLIYLCYFFELMLGAVIFAFGLASIIVLSFSIINQELLGIQAMLGFNQATYQQIIWYGINPEIIITIGLMLIMSLLCVAVNRKRLSAQTSDQLS